MGVLKIESQELFDKTVKEATAEKLVVVDFYATWCGPCKQIAPILEEMSKGEFTEVLFCKVDVDELEDVAASNQVSAMPTFFFFKGGKKVAEVVGANEAKIREAINANK